MISFPLTLKAGVVTVTNKSKANKGISIYVPNKDNIPVTIPAGEKIDITTLSAGETFFYFAQATKDITVSLA